VPAITHSFGSTASLLRPRPLAALVLTGFLVCIASLWTRASHSDSALRRITNTPETAINLNPAISGDGHRIAFESTEDLSNSGGAGGFHALQADLNTTNPTQFVRMALSRAVAPGISQDGSHIAFASTSDPLGKNLDGNSEIFLFDVNTLKQITDTTPASAATRVQDGNFQPSISDDGRFIAFSSNRNLANQNGDANLEAFVFDTFSQTFTQITNTVGTVGAGNVKISGDASHVAFVTDNGTTEAARSRRHHPRRVASPLPSTRNHLVGEGIRHAHVSSPPMAPVTTHASTKADSVA